MLKERVGEGVVGVLEGFVDTIKTAATNSETVEKEDDEAEDDADASTEVQQRRLKQVLFDALYIQRFVARDDGKDGLEGLLRKADVDLDEEGVKRLKKNAGEYAKKTYLLCALLA